MSSQPAVEMDIHTGTSDEPVGLRPSEVLAAERPMNSLAVEHIQVERLGSAIVSAIVGFPLLFGLIGTWFATGATWQFYLALTGYLVLLGLLAFLCIYWPRISYRNYSWRIGSDCLEIHRGVFWKHRIAIPLGRVQHADVSQGPLLRSFDLGKLSIHTAGTSNATIELSGLTHQVSLQLRDLLVQQTQSRQIV